MKDDYSRDYDVAEIETDPRFNRCKKDMIVVQAVFFISYIVAIILAYKLSPADVADMKFAFGFPLWMVVSTVIFILDGIFAIIYTIKNRKFSFEARATDEEVDY